MLQHSGKLSLPGWLGTRRLLREFLVEQKLPDEIRKQNEENLDSGQRAWKITSNDGTS
jgi:hypothetical protein